MSKEDLKTEIYQGVGHASMCWTETPMGVFDDSEATIVSEKILSASMQYAENQNHELLETLKGLVNDVKSKPNDTRHATHLKIAEAVIKKASS